MRSGVTTDDLFLKSDNGVKGQVLVSVCAMKSGKSIGAKGSLALFPIGLRGAAMDDDALETPSIRYSSAFHLNF